MRTNLLCIEGMNDDECPEILQMYSVRTFIALIIDTIKAPDITEFLWHLIICFRMQSELRAHHPRV